MPTLTDINLSPTGNPSGQARAHFSAQAQKLLSELQVRAGQRFEASVTRLSDISTAERKTLLQTMVERSPAMTPRARQALTQLLSAPSLQLAQLQTPTRALHTLTDLPLLKGQVVTLQVRPDGQLQLTPPPAGNNSGAGRGESPMLSGSPPGSQSALLNMPTAASQTSTAAAAPTGLSTPAGTDAPAAEALRSALRQVLPQAQPATRLLNQLAQLPTSSLAKLGSPALHSFLTPLLKFAQQIAPPDQWQRDPVGTLKQAMNNSGIFLEHKLREPTSTGRDAPQQDPKGLLAQALQVVMAIPTAQPSPQTSSPTAALNQFEQALARLFGGPAVAQTGADTPHSALPKLVQGALAQIQLQQYRTLGPLGAELASQPAQLYLDIPLRTPDGYWNLFLHLQELREKEQKPERDKKATRRQSRWKVYLELELDDEGQLAMELNLVDQRLDARFWAERPALRKKTEAGLSELKQQLEARGLQVTDLRCSGQSPPAQKMGLNYSLVDVRT